MLGGVCVIVYPFVIRKEKEMNLFLYVMIFIAGTVFGSFFSLAVYRIPRKENITYVHSHCVKCNHELGVWDLIPVFSYIFLGGKCRYCKEKIRPRYFILEVFSGVVFLVLALSRGISVKMPLEGFIELAITYLFIAGTFIIAGIDKEKFEIPNSLIIYELVIGIIYNIFFHFHCTCNKSFIYYIHIFHISIYFFIYFFFSQFFMF